MIPFVVIVDEAGMASAPAVKERLAAAYRGTHAIASNVFMVPAPYGTRPADIVRTAGMKTTKGDGGDHIEEATGIVIEIARYSGFSNTSLWEWFDNVAKAA